MARVLLVEDEPGIASFVRAGLEEHGHRVLVVDEGTTASRIARDDDFELVILDLGLPDIHGTEVIDAVRRRGEVLPILVLIQTVPKVAMAPLLLMWFGIGMTSKVLTIALIAYLQSLGRAVREPALASAPGRS